MKIPKINTLVVTGMVAAFVAVGFKVAEDNATPQTGWYEVSRIAPLGGDDPTNLEFTGSPSTPSDDGTGCSTKDNDGKTCAVHLTFNGEPMPATLQDAQDANLVVGDHAIAKFPED